MTPEEYYNRRSKTESAIIAGFCFIIISIIILASILFK